jgi:hypothetical protein
MKRLRLNPRSHGVAHIIVSDRSMKPPISVSLRQERAASRPRLSLPLGYPVQRLPARLLLYSCPETPSNVRLGEAVARVLWFRAEQRGCMMKRSAAKPQP